MIPLLSIFVYSYLETDFQGSKRFVSGADRIILAKYAEHVLVGYRNDEQLSELLRIPFAGFFITAHNVTDLDANGLRAKIERIQIVRKNIGFPPAIIASDQEGGPVSRLSPPLPRPKGLGELYKGSSTFISDKAEIRKELRIASGTLSDIGLNLNFAPVTDLKKEHSNSLDFFSKISSRAVSENPEIASESGRDRFRNSFTKRNLTYVETFSRNRFGSRRHTFFFRVHNEIGFRIGANRFDSVSKERGKISVTCVYAFAFDLERGRSRKSGLRFRSGDQTLCEGKNFFRSDSNHRRSEHVSGFLSEGRNFESGVG
ncbi:hypothetical protein LEP1GSC038_3064 [Leptospira weilii str. 2006001855]|uniref:beta-N-acetylhexosaminidase n=1 Tax=Leptospira weilii str. 2006001855 TaxID=996804 RepID=M6FWN9_9LEPT|nr:hypothetical protein LEP1GSC038_3064 [Leptospira weilii str. 2006001855]